MNDLFTNYSNSLQSRQVLAEGVVLLRGFVCSQAKNLLATVQNISKTSPFRHMETPKGYRMSVAMTNCGTLGWISNRYGRGYSPIDPESGEPWPAMPNEFLVCAQNAVMATAFPDFYPDSCLINRYESGSKLSLHQDKDESDFLAPIVSLSFGLPATFLLGGLKRNDPTQHIMLFHGDALILGGLSRLYHHGVLPIKKGAHPATNTYRINLTFRKAAK